MKLTKKYERIIRERVYNSLNTLGTLVIAEQCLKNMSSSEVTMTSSSAWLEQLEPAPKVPPARYTNDGNLSRYYWELIDNVPRFNPHMTLPAEEKDCQEFQFIVPDKVKVFRVYTDIGPNDQQVLSESKVVDLRKTSAQ